MSESGSRSDRVRVLKVRFLERCSQDIATMRELSRAASAGDASALSSIEHLSHRISGTGGTLGFDAMSQSARSLEMLVESVATGGVARDELLLKRAEALLGELDGYVRRANLPES